MLGLAYVGFAAVVALRLARLRADPSWLERATLAAGGVAATAAGAGFAWDAAAEGHDPGRFWWSYALLGALTVGGVVYTLGVVAVPALRAPGWALIAAPLLVPSTLTLALPLVGLLIPAVPTPRRG